VTADLTGAHLVGARFEGAGCGADEKNQSMGLMRATFKSADLSRADLSRANLSRADLRFAKLSGANLVGDRRQTPSGRPLRRRRPSHRHLRPRPLHKQTDEQRDP
jgi:uncharacterized protein YjbI with pentapeptide repeats